MPSKTSVASSRPCRSPLRAPSGGVPGVVFRDPCQDAHLSDRTWTARQEQIHARGNVLEYRFGRLQQV
jgi:hypothetical protein